MDRGAWWAVVHGVAESRTRLSEHTREVKEIALLILMEQVRNDHLYCYQGFLQIKMNFFTKWMIEHRWAKECQMIPNDNKVVN